MKKKIAFKKPNNRVADAVKRFISHPLRELRELICRNKTIARLLFVVLPVRTRSLRERLKKHRRKIIPALCVCCAVVVVTAAAGVLYTENSDYFADGDDSVSFGMVLQNYSTFDHSEKTHIAVHLSWEDGAVDLNGGRAAARIKATVYPINLENKDIIWSSSDENVATIDENGRIDATGAGSTQITANLVSHGKTASARLSVRQPVSGIFLPTSTITLYKGGSARYLNARVFPQDASNKNIKWTSKDTRVARVDNNGTIKGIGIGMTQVTATTEDGGFEASCFVTVVNPSVDVDEIVLKNEDDMNIREGDSINAIVTVSPSNARNKTLKWSSDNEAVASVSQTGRIRGVSAGTATITAQSVNAVTTTFTVTVAGSDEKDPFILDEDEDDYNINTESGVVYTSYDVTFPQAVRIQMAQSPAPKIWARGGSVSATEAQTAEYMNPNSYFEDAYKYQFLDLSGANGISEESLNNYLADKGILRGTGAAFIEAARRYGVSEIYLVAHACLESGNGTSQLSTGVEVNGVTVYNMFGIGAYDNSALYSGSQRAYREGWTSVEEAIIGGAGWISQYYINSENGRQNTLYKMLWNPENPGSHQYATDIGWAVKQAVSIARIFESFPEAALKFDVPVYSGQIPPTISQ